MLKKALIISLIPLFGFALTLTEAKHLMGRTSFTLTKADYAILKSKSKKEAVAWLLKQNQDSDTLPPPSWDSRPKIRNKPPRKMNTQEREAFRKEYKQRRETLKNWWMQTLLQTKTPLREKMTLFWHNHFTSSLKKVRSSYLMLEQNKLLRKYALGNFGDFLHAISKDPAMILYLDNQSNKKQNPNENYAREVLELFTLGEGHYSEKDITESARAYTGWHVNRKKMRFVFVKKLHDYEKKTFLAKRCDFDGDDILDIILQQQRTAQYITTKFYREFINDREINQIEIERIATLFYESHYDISTLLKEILLSPDFWDEKNRAVLVKSPIELIVGTLRALGMQPSQIRPLVSASRQLKQDLFAPPNVKGWAGGVDWLDSSSVLMRRQIIGRLSRGKEMGKMKNKMMQVRENIFSKEKLSKKQKVAFLREYLLPITPINTVNEKKDIKKITVDLIKDPVYQLK